MIVVAEDVACLVREREYWEREVLVVKCSTLIICSVPKDADRDSLMHAYPCFWARKKGGQGG